MLTSMLADKGELEGLNYLESSYCLDYFVTAYGIVFGMVKAEFCQRGELFIMTSEDFPLLKRIDSEGEVERLKSSCVPCTYIEALVFSSRIWGFL